MSKFSTYASFGVIGLMALGLVGCGPGEPATKGGPVEMRRLTEDQYRNVIADVFGTGIAVAGHFDPITRSNGLLAVGASDVNVTASAFQNNETLARAVAAQVVDVTNRDALIPCKPAAETMADEACAKQFYTEVGRMLYRRPLTAEEVQGKVDIASAAAKTVGNFYEGLASGLAGMLLAPDFLYVVDVAEPDPDHPGALRLDAYSKASRLSFLLWNTTPDETLLTAAAKGELNTKSGVSKQVERMLNAPHVEAGVRAFFADMFGFDDFDNLAKDALIYPAFSQAVAADAKEQTLRTVTDLLITHHGDYRDLFTTRKTFMSGPLGLVYHVPADAPGGGWVPYEFPEGDPRQGIVSQVSFVALHAHEGKSSSTLRGKAVRERLLCQQIPPPPAAVNFDLFNDPNSPNKTARQRLAAHAVNPACAGCHKLTDPIGLALENFDGLGQFRTAENGAPIDTAGEIDGLKFDGSTGLGAMMHDNPATTSCLVNRLYSYATGHAPAAGERDWMNYLQERFAADGYRFPELLERIATSDAFFAVAPQSGDAAPVNSAGGTAESQEKKS